MGKYTVIVSRRADEMLIRHAGFLAQVRVSAARRMTAEFEKALDTLEQNPFPFPMILSIWMPCWIAGRTTLTINQSRKCGAGEPVPHF